MTTKPLDPLFVRSQFPAAVWEWTFFESAGGSFVPRSVIDRLMTARTACCRAVRPADSSSVAATSGAESREPLAFVERGDLVDRGAMGHVLSLRRC